MTDTKNDSNIAAMVSKATVAMLTTITADGRRPSRPMAVINITVQL